MKGIKLRWLSRALALIASHCLWVSYSYAVTPSPEVVAIDAQNTIGRFTNLNDGEVINQSFIYWDYIDDKLKIQGEFEEIPKYMDTSNLMLLVNRQDIDLILGSTFEVDTVNGAAAFEVDLPMPVFIPGNFPVLDFTIELVYEPNDQAIARERVTLYDLRDDQGATVIPEPVEPTVGINYQLTNYGLGGASVGDPTGIEAIVLAEYPSPSMEDFNALLATKAEELSSQSVSGLEKCIDYRDIEEENFSKAREFSAYRQAMNNARKQYAAYQFCQSSGKPGCDLFCVKELPKANDFKLCVDTISGTPNAATVADFTDLELEFIDGLQPGLINADLTFEGYQTFVDLYLSGLSVEWRDSAVCFPPPPGTLEDFDIASAQWLVDWTTCRETEINAAVASTDLPDGISPHFAINTDPTDAQQLDVYDYRLTEFGFESITRDAAKGTCAKDFISGTADAFLYGFVDDALLPLAGAVNHNQPDTALARLIDEAFGEMAIGQIETDEYDLNADIYQVATSTVNGLMIDWETLIQPLDVEDMTRYGHYYLAQLGNIPYLSENSLDAWGNVISSKFGLNTWWINNMIRVHSTTEALHRQLAFSEEELGIGNSTKSLITEFDGGLLAPHHLVFNELDGQEVEFRLRRNVDAFVFQQPDPLELTDVGHPTSYGANGWRLSVKEPDKIDPTTGEVLEIGEVFIELALSFYESDFSLISGTLPEVRFLEPLFSTIAWQIHVEDMDFPSCKKFTHYSASTRVGSCESELENALILLLQDKLDAVAAALVSQIPTPQYFALEGDSNLELDAVNRSRLHSYGAMDVFDILELGVAE